MLRLNDSIFLISNDPILLRLDKLIHSSNNLIRINCLDLRKGVVFQNSPFSTNLGWLSLSSCTKNFVCGLWIYKRINFIHTLGYSIA